jgi:serine/threonine protein kinase
MMNLKEIQRKLGGQFSTRVHDVKPKSAQELFQSELSVLKMLNHPNVITLHEYIHD